MVSLKHIAKDVGVSVAAVSMALNDHPTISSKTKARVIEAQRRLGYRPNRHARMLRRQGSPLGQAKLTTGNIGFLLIGRTFEDPVYAPLFQGVFDAASQRNLHLFYHTLKRADLHAGRLPSLIRDHEVDGLVISGVYEAAEHEALGHLSVPRVLLGLYEVTAPTLMVEVDLAQGIRLALERLHALGHRRVAFIAEQVDVFVHRLVARLFEAESRRLWGGWDPELLQVAGEMYEGGYEATRQALALRERPTALLLATERLAAAAYDVCAELHLRIPQECSVVSFGGAGQFYHYRPSLAVVTGDSVAMGRAAVNELLESLGQSPLTPHRTVFPMGIRDGQSWGPSPH